MNLQYIYEFHLFYMNIDYTICEEYETSNISYYNKMVSVFLLIFNFPTITFIFAILIEIQVRTVPPKLQS